MNVLDHIKAGHYPTDNLCRPLVPHTMGGHLVVCATDMPGACPILGFHVKPDGNRSEGRNADQGWGYYPHSEFLLPPPSRKVKVSAIIRINGGSPPVVTGWTTSPGDHRIRPGTYLNLTGEIEEPWS